MSDREQRRAERRLRRQVRRQLQDFGIRPPLRVDEVCERLGQHRGRPIRLVSYPIPVPGPFGLWLATHSADYILYQSETTPSHQDHIILHELGHILANHASNDTDDAVWQELMPNIPPEMLRRALRRTSYDSVAEREAELIATIIKEWAAVLDYVTPRTSEVASVERVQDALGDRQGWL